MDTVSPLANPPEPTVRELTISMCAYEHMALSDALTRASELGFTQVELVADQPHLFLVDWTVGRMARLARELEGLGLRVAAVTAETGRGFFSPIPPGPIHEPSLITPQASGRRLRQEYLQRALDFSLGLGAPTLVVASGACLPGVPPALGWELLIEGLSLLLSRAEDVGVLIAVAPRPGHLVATTRDFLALQQALQHPLLGISLDTAQLMLAGEAAEGAVAATAGRIWRVQLTDARRPSPYRLRPGLGDTDLAGALSCLRAARFGGPVVLSLENYTATPDRAVQEALAHLATLSAPPASAA